MSYFKPLNTKKYFKTGAVVTPDTVYWKRLGVPTLLKEFGGIDYIDFSPVEPYCFAVTCSVRVQIYNPITKLVVKNLSRFQENAYGGVFRQDGRLLVAGDEEGAVRLFDTSSGNLLRLFRGHKGPVHRVQFTADLLHVASFSDDKTVKLWDIATEKVLHTFEAHGDYIRAGAVNPVVSNVIVSGGYDGLIKLYDTRTKEVQCTVDHGSPVESLLFLPTGGMVISAGGTEVRAWDAFAGCRLVSKLSQHHKTVTSLRIGSNGQRIFSGSLDRHVKIYDVASYSTVHTMDFPNSVLSLGVASNDQTVAVGLVDGLISVQNMDVDRSKTADSNPLSKKRRVKSVNVDHEVVDFTLDAEAKYNYFLRKYEYHNALKTVLMPYVVSKTPEITVCVMQELIHRKGLHRALKEKKLNHAFLDRVISFITRHITEHRFMRVLVAVGMILLDVYEDMFHEFTGDLGKSFIKMSAALQKECKLTHELLQLQGSLELLTDAANISADSDSIIHFVPDEGQLLKPSVSATQSKVTLTV